MNDIGIGKSIEKLKEIVGNNIEVLGYWNIKEGRLFLYKPDKPEYVEHTASHFYVVTFDGQVYSSVPYRHNVSPSNMKFI